MSNLPQKMFDDGNLPSLNTGQKALFLLVCDALEQKRAIQFKECKYIYKMAVQKSDFSSWYYLDEETQKYVQVKRKYSDNEVDNKCNGWLLRTLGSLIKKGYLTVIPRIELKKTLSNEHERSLNECK